MFRIGSGHDSHRLIDDRPLILGGVTIPHTRGLDGHSDADVVLHALTDALLGAIAAGDIGDLFPDSDPRNKNAGSHVFLAAAHKMVLDVGYELGNCDITIFAQEPKLGASKLAIRTHVARLLGIGVDQVSIKAKTGERVGHIGRAEAIGCHAVVLLRRGRA